jgi:hypothetical protein
LQTPEKLSQDVLLGATLHNPLLVISISIIVGTLFGQASAQLAGKWTKN